jgi:diguanylate cyclase (GGDEF)-like protein
MGWQRSFLNFIFITVLLSGIGVYISNIPEQQLEQGRWVTHTHEVLNQLITLSRELTEARAAHSDYIQTHTANDYDIYSRTTHNIQQTLDGIENLTRDSPNQQTRIPQLRQSITSQMNRVAQDMDASRIIPAASAPADPNKTETTAIGQRIDTMRQEEEQLLNERVERWHTAMLHTRLLILSGIGLLYALILFAYSVMRKEARIREQFLEIENQAVATQLRTAAQMAKVAEIQQDIIYQRLNLQNAMKIITTRTQDITHADGAVMEMLEGEDMAYRATSGAMEPLVGLRLKAQGSISGLCVASTTTLRCDDSETDERVDKAACRKVGLRSLIVTPLIHEGKAVGVLKVASSRTHAFTSEEVSTLQLMAGVASAILRDALASDALQDVHKSLTMSNQLLQTQKTQLESDKIELITRADTDGMTGLKNYHYFQERLAEEYYRTKRYKNPLSLIMIDIDHFKQFNDRLGHPTGDEILKQMGMLLKNSARPSDCVARYGGEEFAIILTQTSLEGAIKIAERIRETIRNASWPHGAITVSMGISGLENGADNAPALIEQADKALYQSKTQGRDRATPFAA